MQNQVSAGKQERLVRTAGWAPGEPDLPKTKDKHESEVSLFSAQNEVYALPIKTNILWLL
jgi:hypothetical protein